MAHGTNWDFEVLLLFVCFEEGVETENLEKSRWHKDENQQAEPLNRRRDHSYSSFKEYGFARAFFKSTKWHLNQPSHQLTSVGLEPKATLERCRCSYPCVIRCPVPCKLLWADIKFHFVLINFLWRIVKISDAVGISSTCADHDWNM